MALSAAGWKLTLSGRNEQRLQETIAMCASEARTVFSKAGDVREEEYVKELFALNKEKHGEQALALTCDFLS